MIIVFAPYCPEKEGTTPAPGMDLGYANNESMRRLFPEDWGFLLEHDLLPTTTNWYRQLELAVMSKPEAGFFTAMRWFGPPEMRWCVPEFDGVSTEVLSSWRFHRKHGRRLEKKHWGELQDITDHKNLPGGNPTSGIFLVSKSVWEEVGGFKRGFKFIDYDFHQRVCDAGYRGYLIRGLYFYHQRGALGKIDKFKRLMKMMAKRQT